MFRFLFQFTKHHSHHYHRNHLPHRQVRVGRNWFYIHSVPNAKHPEYLEQRRMCLEVIDDLIKYGLLESENHSRIWKISKDIHIPSLRYYLCQVRPGYKFRLKSKKKWFSKTRDVRIYVEHANVFTYQPSVHYDPSYRP